MTKYNMIDEQWKDVPGYEGLYAVSNFGQIKRTGKVKTGQLLKLQTNKAGYLRANLNKNSDSRYFFVHRLVAVAFISEPPFDGAKIKHKNGIKADNRADNLEWIIQSRNKDTQRFWSKVDKSGGDDACWNWTGSLKANGYGQIQIGGNNGKNLYAHRFAYEITHGAIPDGLNVCHHCDNRKCCNPLHLFTATQKENIHDMIKKGRRRSAESVLRGELAPNRKLNWETVEYIRRRFTQGGITKAELGRQVGIHPSVIADIVNGVLWRSPK